MRIKVNLPKSGMGIEEGTVARWLKAVGDRIDAGETIVEVESAKAVEEIHSPTGGTLVEILVTEGQTIPVNSPLGVIEDGRD